MNPHLKPIVTGNEVPYGYRIRYLGNSFTGPVYKYLRRQYEITAPEYVVVMCLAHATNLNAKDISEVSGRSKNSVSRAISLLVGKGFVSESVDPNDRRQKTLKLEPAGESFYRETIPLFEERQRRMLAVLTNEEKAILDLLLNKLILREDDWRE